MMGLGWGGLREWSGCMRLGACMGLCAPQWARGTGLHAVGRMGFAEWARLFIRFNGLTVYGLTLLAYVNYTPRPLAEAQNPDSL